MFSARCCSLDEVFLQTWPRKSCFYPVFSSIHLFVLSLVNESRIRKNQQNTLTSCWYSHAFCTSAGLQWVGTPFPRPTISVVWRSLGLGVLFYVGMLIFQLTSHSEFGQDNGPKLEIQGPTAKFKRDQFFSRGPMDLYRSHYLKITL